MKKKFLTGPEIDQLSGPASAETVSMLQASFRIAARVANTAWKYIQEKQFLDTQPDGSSSYAMYRAQSDLQEALHEYSPENWPPPKPTAHEVLVGVYDECSAAPTKEAVLEILYRAIERTQD